MTTSLDAYRSDREQLVARVRELEQALAERETKPLGWLHRCPVCGAKEMHGTEIPEDHKQYPGTWRGWTYPRVCCGLRRLVCRLSRSHHQPHHLHQRCTSCGARWVVDAVGWRLG